MDLPRCIFSVARLVVMAAGLSLSISARADEASGVILSNLPDRASARYAELKRLSGSTTGEILEMTKAERWLVPPDRLAAFTQAAVKEGVVVKPLDATWNHALAPMGSDAHMTPKQSEMMHTTMGQAPVMGMTMMTLPAPEFLEYALTKGMHGEEAGADPASLVIQLTETLSVTALRTSINKTKDGYSWHGVVAGTDEPVTLLWWADGRLSGSVTYSGHIYSVRSLGGGMHGVIELAPDRLPPEHAPMGKGLMRKMQMKTDTLVQQGDASMLEPHRKKPPGPHTGGRDLKDAPDGQQRMAALSPAAITGGHFRDAAHRPEVVITVLVAYTKAAARYYSDIERDLIALAIEESNQSFRNSGLGNIRLEAVHTYGTDYVEHGSHFDHVFSFANKGDGVMDEVHALREQYKANVAVLIVDDPMGCGLAAQIRAPEDRAFAVVDQACAATSYSLAHEIGHLIGARHDMGLDDSLMPFAYGHGFVHGTEWRTMMGYKESCGGCARIPVWSSPAIMIRGVPAGDAASDNARVIADEAARVAAFK